MMTVTAYQRGHHVTWDPAAEVFHYTDTGAPSHGGTERPCVACGLTAEGEYGPDPCVGWLPGLKGGYCCGHGIDTATSHPASEETT